ncbi:BTB domain-containing protein [Aphelenchoides besseyi]|nr:BTB domain-containing protein [Aphelenchoides besseyi]
MSDGDDQTSDLSVSFLCGDREMATCDHQSMLEIEYQWTVSEVCNSWEKVEGRKRRKSFSFPFLPKVALYVLFSGDLFGGENAWSISCEDKSAADDFEFNMLEDFKLDTKQEMLALSPFSLTRSLLPMHCKIVYKKPCPICFPQKTAREIKKLQDELAVQTSNVANLTVERDNLTFGIARMECERDKWKAIARERGAKLADMTEELQSTTKQLNSTVEQLKLDNRSLTDNHESLWKLQKENKLTDFSLMVDNKSIQVHKVVLAMKSKFFAQQFEEHPEKLEYSIEGTTFEAVEQMVEFVYLGDAENFDEHLNELYILSVRFHIDALKEKCVKSLESKLTIETSPEVFILATKYKDEKLSQIVIDYKEQNGGKESLYSSNAFYHLLETDVELYKEVAKTLRRSTNQN